MFKQSGIPSDKIPYATVGTGACECITALTCVSMSFSFKNWKIMLWWIEIRWLAWSLKDIPFICLRQTLCSMLWIIIHFNRNYSCVPFWCHPATSSSHIISKHCNPFSHTCLCIRPPPCLTDSLSCFRSQDFLLRHAFLFPSVASVFLLQMTKKFLFFHYLLYRNACFVVFFFFFYSEFTKTKTVYV